MKNWNMKRKSNSSSVFGSCRWLFTSLLLSCVILVNAGCSAQAQTDTKQPGSFQSLPESPVFGEFGTQGGVSFLLTDFPIKDQNITSVVVNFRSIEVNSVSGWQTLIDFGEEGQLYDLLKLQNGVTAELGAFSLEPGTYNQIRLVLNDSNYVETTVNGVTEQKALKIPSGSQTGIKLIQTFEVNSQGYTTFTLDFNAQESVSYNKGQGFMLKPVIKIIDTKTATGASSTISAANGGRASILGEVAIDIPGGALQADAIVEIVPVTGPVPQPFSNKTLLSRTYEFLPDGTKFNQDVTITYNYDPVEVAALGLDVNSLEMAYYDMTKKDWVSIGGTVNTVANTVTATVNHFTAFGVMGGGNGATISPAEIRYAGYDPVTLTDTTAVPEKIIATIIPKKNTTITSVTLYVIKAGQVINPLGVPMILNTVSGEYEYTLAPALYYPELPTVLTPTYDVQVMIEVIDSGGNSTVAPAKAVSTAPLSYHLYSYDPDLDADLMNDRWEVDNLLDPTLATDAPLDADGDGITNLVEYQSGKNPNGFDATISGTVTGLDAGDTLTISMMEIQNPKYVEKLNMMETLNIVANGTGIDTFQFIKSLTDGAKYRVTILKQKNSIKTCSIITGGAGIIAGAHVTVNINCIVQQFEVGGTVIGLTGTVTLQNNGADNLIITADGFFTFTTPVISGTPYNVTILTQPVGQSCIVTNGAGIQPLKNVTNIVVSCAGTFVTVGSLSEYRGNHTSTLLNDGDVLIAGGSINPSAELYKPGSGLFNPTGPMNSSRLWHTATLLQNGEVLITGGYNSSIRQTLASNEIYDPVTGTFRVISSMSTGRYKHTATLLNNGKVLIIGGAGSLTSAEIYDPVTDTFTVIGTLLTRRVNHKSVLLNNGTVLITGGNYSSATAEIYDPVTNTFSLTGSMTSFRTYPESVLLNNGKVLIAGGNNWATTGTAEIYDPVTRRFTSIGLMTSWRYYHQVTMMADGNVLITGSNMNGPSSTNSAIFNSLNNTFFAITPMNVARQNHRATKLNDNTVLITGGGNGPAELYTP